MALVLCFLKFNKMTQTYCRFTSRTLSPTESKYLTVKKEAFGCVCTDHQALTTLQTSKGSDRAGMHVACWAARLLCFTYDIAYLPGSQDNTADCLSHLPLPTSRDDAILQNQPWKAAVPDFLMVYCSSCYNGHLPFLTVA
ncbi:hypothetical protein ATANTOWER_022301 [Ataeniobius toweri]|uniref:Reverse transcriptase RNase H-like domain-containing protein n=1 Tax=Ataeniobius toweri TaxID=208326 RepID=A0ABU7B3B2_9TELE|nr:hypothetical protein [Ataeniobius toweri]